MLRGIRAVFQDMDMPQGPLQSVVGLQKAQGPQIVFQETEKLQDMLAVFQGILAVFQGNSVVFLDTGILQGILHHLETLQGIHIAFQEMELVQGNLAVVNIRHWRVVKGIRLVLEDNYPVEGIHLVQHFDPFQEKQIPRVAEP